MRKAFYLCLAISILQVIFLLLALYFGSTGWITYHAILLIWDVCWTTRLYRLEKI